MSGAPDPWRGALVTGAVAAVGSVVLIVVQVVVFVVHPPPATVQAFMDLMTRDPLLGLVSLDLLYSVNNVLVALVYLALAVLLWPHARSAVTVAGLLVVLGMATYLASNPAVEMLLLARRHADADPAAQAALLAAGEVLLASWRGTAFLTYYVLNAVGLLVMALVMLRTRVFSGATGWWALAAGVLMLVPSTFGTVGLLMSVASLVPWCVLCVLVAVRFVRR